MRIILMGLLMSLTIPLSSQILGSSGIGIEVYPHFANRRLIAGNAFSFNEVRRIDSLESGKQGFGIGILYSKRSEKIGFQIGLRYLSTGYETARGPVDINTQPSDFNEFSENFTASFLEIPFQLNFYQNLGNKSALYFTLGTAAGLHLNSRADRVFYSAESSETIDDFDTELNYRGLNFALITAIGFETTLNERWTLGIQPTFEYWLSGNVVTDAAGINRNLYNIGFRLSVRRELFNF